MSDGMEGTRRLKSLFLSFVLAASICILPWHCVDVKVYVTVNNPRIFFLKVYSTSGDLIYLPHSVCYELLIYLMDFRICWQQNSWTRNTFLQAVRSLSFACIKQHQDKQNTISQFMFLHVNDLLMYDVGHVDIPHRKTNMEG